MLRVDDKQTICFSYYILQYFLYIIFISYFLFFCPCCRLEYKNDYENFKFKMILISMLFTILDLFVFNYRYVHEIKKLLCLLTTLYIYVHVLRIVLGFPVNLILLKKYLSNKELNLLCRITDALFHALLLWYYSTLTLQEHILIANGSRCGTVSKKCFVSKLIIYMTKLLDSDRLRAVQFFCKRCKKELIQCKNS